MVSYLGDSIGVKHYTVTYHIKSSQHRNGLKLFMLKVLLITI